MWLHIQSRLPAALPVVALPACYPLFSDRLSCQISFYCLFYPQIFSFLRISFCCLSYRPSSFVLPLFSSSLRLSSFVLLPVSSFLRPSSFALLLSSSVLPPVPSYNCSATLELPYHSAY